MDIQKSGMVPIHARPRKHKCFLCSPFYVKGVSLGYVGRNGNLKDLKQAFEEMLYRPPFLVFLAVSLFESVDLIWSARTTVRSNHP